MKKIRVEQLKNGKSITRMAIVLFSIAVSIGIWGTYLLHTSVKRQQEAEETRLFYKEMGDNLAYAANYMNAEVQAFAVTGEMSHFYNYWTEADITKTREAVLEEMEKANAPEDEIQFLREAKKISDQLMETEIGAIQLVLHSRGISEDSFNPKSNIDQWVTKVLSYPMKKELEQIRPEDQQRKAISMLFDKEYLGRKVTITVLVDECNARMNKRLEQAVYQSRRDTIWATGYEVLFIFLAFSILGGILLVFHKLFVSPIQFYTEEIRNQMKEKKRGYLLVKPAGSTEMIQFGEEFNYISSGFYKEMETRKKAESMMAKAREEAVRANRFKSNFLAQFTHEIRTPLNAVNGYTWLLTKTKLNEVQKKYVNHIEVASKNLLHVINHILDYSKIEAGKMILEYKDFFLRDIIGELYCVLENEAFHKGLILNIQVEEEIPDLLKGDGVRLYQVLQNLIYNGIKFTEKGEVRLEVYHESDNAKGCTLGFYVKDTGCGIAEEYLEKIFEPYSQKAGIESGGTGLGLAICREIIQTASNGTYDLNVESREKEGSCFSFLMDFYHGEEMAVQEEIAKEYEEEANILLVEDNPVNLLLEKRILVELGYNVKALSDSVSACEAVRKKQFDLILLDIGMPDIDGYELAKQMKNMGLCKDTSILALTAYDRQHIEEHKGAKEFDDYLSKPVSPAILKEKIEFYLRKKLNKMDERRTFVDIERLMELLNQNEDALKELLLIFVQDKENADEAIYDCIKEGSMEEAHNLIHSLKGVSSNLFLNPLESECVRLLQKMDKTLITTKDLEALHQILHDTCRNVKEWLGTKKGEEEEEKTHV